jgi:hypothetical protein
MKRRSDTSTTCYSDRRLVSDEKLLLQLQSLGATCVREMLFRREEYNTMIVH